MPANDMCGIRCMPQPMTHQCACGQGIRHSSVKTPIEWQPTCSLSIMVSMMQAALAAVDMFDCNGVTTTEMTIPRISHPRVCNHHISHICVTISHTMVAQAAPAAVDMFDCDGVTTTVTTIALHSDDAL